MQLGKLGVWAPMDVLSAAEGGRHTPFSTGYTPQFFFGATDVTGSLTIPDDGVVEPGVACVLAHHLGFRVRGLTNESRWIQPTGNFAPRLDELRAAGAWMAHPVKGFWESIAGKPPARPG